MAENLDYYADVLLDCLIGAISSNFRQVSIRLMKKGSLVIEIVLEEENADDREEIVEIDCLFENAFEKTPNYSINVQVSRDSMLSSSLEENRRIVFQKKESLLLRDVNLLKTPCVMANFLIGVISDNFRLISIKQLDDERFVVNFVFWEDSEEDRLTIEQLKYLFKNTFKNYSNYVFTIEISKAFLKNPDRENEIIVFKRRQMLG